MSQARFRFYAELNDFLPPARKQVEFDHPFNGRGSIKDMIESLGVPHTEIDLILVNGVSVDFSYIVQDADRVGVYPVFESFDITPLVRLRPQPLRDPRFVLDIHLGKLAAYMRMVGFDTLYRNDYEDSELAHISKEDRRTLLTKDRGLLKRSMVTHGYCVRETNPRLQLGEVLRRFDLFNLIAPFRRCIRCNSLIESVPKAAVLAQLSPDTCQYYDEFWQCQSCDQVYWRGSHYQHMQQFIDEVIKAEFNSGE
ncbi:MAG: Mut7-C ubiquitin/RNAse domain-containing protein [Chloroflexi bacterium]|nr:Mut7-C ubiquitin/RNAse domain-containing protein [Chloroflexota bacterium]